MNNQVEKRGLPLKTKRIMILAAAALFVCVLAVSFSQVVSIQQTRDAAFSEYSKLQKQFSSVLLPLSGEEQAEASHAAVSDLRGINPDFMGWLLIPEAAIDYPIVRGSDNDRYLRTTFEGNANPAGSIFMDAGNKQAFGDRHVILYGHNMQNGSMFGQLYQYLDAGYREDNSLITITAADGKLLQYAIFDAKIVTVENSCYQIGFDDDTDFLEFAEELSAPAGAASLLTLSTCAERGDQDERIVVHAVLMPE